MFNTSTRNTISVFFLMVFVTVIFLPKSCYAKNRSLWQKRQKNIRNTTTTQGTLKKTFERQVDPLKIKVPEAYGTIIEAHRGSNGRIIVHIQDAHANYEGQENLANILESLIKDYELNLILVEGGSTDADFTYLRNRGSLEERKRKAGSLLEDGTISGEEYLNIASDYPMSFQGIEDRALYDANVNALWEIDRFKDIAAEYVDKLIAASDALKPRIYNTDLLDLDKAKKDYENEGTDLLTYYEYLHTMSEKKGIPLYPFPNFRNLIEVSKLEKRIDLAKIKDGKATEEEIRIYREYTEASKDMDINKLFKEETLLEDSLSDSMTTNPDQKTLIKISKALSIMKNLLNVKVVPEEYDYFLKHKGDFNPKLWADFLNKKRGSYNLSLKIPSNYYVIMDNLQKIEDFYKIADERNKVFLRKTQERMDKDNARIAALIAGGFHTPILTRLLSDAGYSYIVVSPRTTEETDDAFYRSTLRSEWLPE